MAGPYPPPDHAGAEAYPYPPQFPQQPPYPGPLPPPVSYSAPPRPGRALWWALGAMTVAAVVLAGLVVFGGIRATTGSGAFTDAAAKTAIQDYLSALSTGDTQTIARNTACGMYDALRSDKSDLALARLASDAFRKQFSSAEVTSVDKIVLSSSYQAQVLFTMRVEPRSPSRNARDEEQGVAQILRQDDQLLVCSYLLRTAAQY